MNKTLSGHLQELKKQRKCPLGLSQEWPQLLAGAVAHESFSFQSLSLIQFKQGLIKVVVTKAGRLQDRSKGELRLYNFFFYINCYSICF